MAFMCVVTSDGMYVAFVVVCFFLIVYNEDVPPLSEIENAFHLFCGGLTACWKRVMKI